jgi:hypothetical protein
MEAGMTGLAIYLLGVIAAAILHWRFGHDVWSDMTWIGRAVFALAWPFCATALAFGFIWAALSKDGSR